MIAFVPGSRGDRYVSREEECETPGRAGLPPEATIVDVSAHRGRLRLAWEAPVIRESRKGETRSLRDFNLSE